MDAIKVDSVTRLYGEHTAVNDLSFSVNEGHIHGFLGPNGAGKTTTMKMIAGLLPTHAGSILVNNQSVNKNLNEIKKDLGLLLETPPLFSDMDVREYLAYVALLHRVPKEDVDKSVDYAIEKLKLHDVENRLCGNLSKGFKQRVGIAQAIVHNPKIVILDEPTVGLDPEAVIEIRQFIKELKKDHTILLSSHLLHEISLVCDEVTIINKGRLVATGSVAQITDDINKKNILSVKISDLTSEQINKMNQWFYIKEVVELAHNDNEWELQIILNSLEDHRYDFIKNCVNHDIQLVSIEEKKTSLEEIFIQMTKEDNK
jgi:ABC-2 type transport system ATP-binding protein